MTIKELKDILSNFKDDVIVGVYDGNTDNISDIERARLQGNIVLIETLNQDLD